MTRFMVFAAAPHMHHISDADQELGQNGGLALVAMQMQISCCGQSLPAFTKYMQL